MQKAQFGMIGLGTMGRNLVLNMADHGFSVAGYDRNADQLKRLLEEGKDKQVQALDTMAAFVDSLETPRRIMMLVPAGKIVDAVIDEICPLLQKGDILIDGGNSHFRDTDARIGRLVPTGIHFTGMGISGGEDGARLGPSMMPGGNKDGYTELKNIFEKIAAQSDEGACVTFIGNGSAGHYTKMVHNGIEYAIMQLISEAYAMLKNVAGCDNDELNNIFTKWNEGPLQSFLIEITAAIFLQKDDIDSNQRLVDIILDKAAQKGTGMWTSASAMELHIPIPTIDEAVAARDISIFKSEREMIDSFTDNALQTTIEEKELFIQTLHDALYFGIAVSYIQGLHLLQEASLAYKYEINIAEVVRIWKGGCIIRSLMLNDIRKAYLKNDLLKNLLMDKDFYLPLLQHRKATTTILKTAMDHSIGMPALSSALHYVDMFGTARLASNLIQAQRDYFGAHTYERINKDGNFHTSWS
ncbi:MAG TPA: NADP-dependent phosphogluconate dehydrogenase [Ferruginibacter sp.]|nr:NADP-dependent phosphogluconate dehydrogenase [Ferruginibacter sp.]